MYVRYWGIIIIFLISFLGLEAQEIEISNSGSKGSVYLYWGWNSGWFTNSDLRFSGDGYDFVLSDVQAKDRQSSFGFDPYFHPGKFTIPQTNFRVGYFFKENWDVSFGIDHMKYVLQNDQTVKISGNIALGNDNYDGTFVNEDIVLTKDFLEFEHTDGLNYINIELRHIHQIMDYKSLQFSIIEGGGVGLLFPRTRTVLLGALTRDAYKVSGVGIAPVLGLKVKLYKWFFIQSEFKTGYINMPGIKIDNSENGNASQSFFFAQWNYSFGFSKKF